MELAGPYSDGTQMNDTSLTLSPSKRGFGPRGCHPHATLLVQPRPIDQYSPLPPVGVLDRSQFQCGDLPLRTLLIVSWVGRPRLQPNQTHPIRHRWPFVLFWCHRRTSYGIRPPFDGLSRGDGQVGYALLTRAPVAIGLSKAKPCCPMTCMLKFPASVHPEPGSNSPL